MSEITTKIENEFIREDGIVKKCIKCAKENFYELIPALAVIREKKLYLAEKHSSFESYLQQPEYVLDPPTYDRYISAYIETKAKISEKEIKEIPVSNLLIISRLEDPKTWVHDAAKLSRNGLKEKIKEEHPKMRGDIRKKQKETSHKNFTLKDDLLEIPSSKSNIDDIPESHASTNPCDNCQIVIKLKKRIADLEDKIQGIESKKLHKKMDHRATGNFDSRKFSDRWIDLFKAHYGTPPKFTEWEKFRHNVKPKLKVCSEEDLIKGLDTYFKDTWYDRHKHSPLMYLSKLDVFLTVKKEHKMNYSDMSVLK